MHQKQVSELEKLSSYSVEEAKTVGSNFER